MMNVTKLFAENSATQGHDLVIAGGGLSALFTAYEILRQGTNAGKELDVMVLADVLNAPCSAGSHVVLEHEGLFQPTLPGRQRRDISRLFREGLEGLETTIADEEIDCSLHRGYEWKSPDKADLQATVADVIAKRMYRTDEFNFDPDVQAFNLPGYDHSVRLDCIGQVNMGKLVGALTERIRDMGGQVWERGRYLSQETLRDGRTLVRSSLGSIVSRRKPLIATGAVHMRGLQGFTVDTNVVYTMCLVLGPLGEEDARRICPTPTAFSDTNMQGDVLWGGIDDMRRFTIGKHHVSDSSPIRQQDIRADLLRFVDGLYPGLTKKYPTQASFGAMLVAKNHLPVVGRMKSFDVMGGWAGEGIVPGYAAAQAYARWVLYNDDYALKIFESMQPEGTYQNAPAAEWATAPRPQWAGSLTA